MRHASPEVFVSAPSPAMLGYLAGIMDGEGYFSATAKSRAFGMRVAMIDREVIDWLHDNFAGSVSRAGETVVGNRVHTWTLSRQADLAFVLRRLIPLLVLKRRQAEAMLTLVEHLQARPAWEKPTSQVPKSERAARREAVEAWSARGFELRRAVPAAR